MSRTSRDPHAAFEYAQRAIELRPDDPRVQATVRQRVLDKLAHDAFVVYLAETAQTYVVSFRNSRPFVVPKARAEPEVFPPATPGDGARVLGMVWWVLLGLLPSGIGALLLGPLVAQRALGIMRRGGLNAAERRRAQLALALACGLALLGGVLALLLVLRLVG